MNIDYNFKVVKVARELGMMEVLYTAAGYPDVLVGMPLPNAGNLIEDIIRSYSPVMAWAASVNPTQYADVAEGHLGSLTYISTERHHESVNSTDPTNASQLIDQYNSELLRATIRAEVQSILESMSGSTV